MKNVPDIFKDPELQAKFDQYGYVKVPLLDNEQIQHMDAYFDRIHSELPDSGFNSDSASEEIKRVFEPSFEQYFKNYTSFGGSFLYKMPSENSELPPHQDWTIVDEEKEVALNCWVPLCDTSIENGTLMVLPGTNYHKIPTYRAPTLPFFFSGNEDLIMERLVPMNAKAGEAVILNESLVHYSPPNLSNSIRKAITAGIKTADAPMRFYYYDKERDKHELDMYMMEEDFLIMFENFMEDIFKPPKHGKKVATVPYEFPKLERDELIRFLDGLSMAESNNGKKTKNHSLLSRLKEKLTTWTGI